MIYRSQGSLEMLYYETMLAFILSCAGATPWMIQRTLWAKSDVRTSLVVSFRKKTMRPQAQECLHPVVCTFSVCAYYVDVSSTYTYGKWPAVSCGAWSVGGWDVRGGGERDITVSTNGSKYVTGVDSVVWGRSAGKRL
jgi:hypothetical protein